VSGERAPKNVGVVPLGIVAALHHGTLKFRLRRLIVEVSRYEWASGAELTRSKPSAELIATLAEGCGWTKPVGQSALDYARSTFSISDVRE
jgi:hypothetical protein